MFVVLTQTVVEFTTASGDNMMVEKGEDGKYTIYNKTTQICNEITPDQIMKQMAMTIKGYQK